MTRRPAETDQPRSGRSPFTHAALAKTCRGPQLDLAGDLTQTRGSSTMTNNALAHPTTDAPADRRGLSSREVATRLTRQSMGQPPTSRTMLRPTRYAGLRTKEVLGWIS